MSTEIVGFLQDEGYSPTEIREMVGPFVPYADEEFGRVGDIMDMEPASRTALHDDPHASDANRDVGSPEDPHGRQQAVRAVLTVARDSRQLPGPHTVVPSGVINSMPQSQAAKAVRVDTEESFRAFRRGDGAPRNDAPGLSDITDAPDEAENTLDALSNFSQNELMGNIMDMEPASRTALHDDPHAMVGPDQACLLCGLLGAGRGICGNCTGRLPEILGLFERGYASQMLGYEFERGYASQVIGFGERGAAASLYDDNPSTMHGGGFYRLKRHADEMSDLLGDGFYRLPQQEKEYGYDGIPALIGDVMALSVPSTVYAEEIPLSFKRPADARHVIGWKRGEHIYGSIRVTGWDGRPRILTSTTPYDKEVGIVVGYAESARIAPTNTIAILDPLARQLGASRLLPRLAASAPAVLRVSADKAAPLILSVMPE